jgi:hypothetical protein
LTRLALDPQVWALLYYTFIPYHINLFIAIHSPAVDETGSGFEYSDKALFLYSPTKPAVATVSDVQKQEPGKLIVSYLQRGGGTIGMMFTSNPIDPILEAKGFLQGKETIEGKSTEFKGMS